MRALRAASGILRRRWMGNEILLCDELDCSYAMS
jgi:hypothetical protein